MSKSFKRTIVVSGEIYEWILDGNTIYNSEKWIRIHKGKATKSILFVNPYHWQFEIRPKSIKEAIEFAIGLGWDSEQSTRNLFLDYGEDGFYVLEK